jgi:hypothetical protein
MQQSQENDMNFVETGFENDDERKCDKEKWNIKIQRFLNCFFVFKLKKKEKKWNVFIFLLRFFGSVDFVCEFCIDPKLIGDDDRDKNQGSKEH